MIISDVHYILWFADLAEYNAAVAATGGGSGFKKNPEYAAALLGITWPPAGGGPITGTKGILNAGPYNIYGYFPDPSVLPTNVDSVIVAPAAGYPPAFHPAGQYCTFQWYGVVVYSPNEVTGGVPPATPMPQRRWIAGQEHTNTSHELGDGYTNFGSREASRTMDGMGITICGNNTSGQMLRLVDAFRPGLTPKNSWERFYIRVRSLPTAGTQRFWRFHTTINSVNGGTIGITTAGEVIAENLPATGIYSTLGTTTPLVLNKWYLIDVILNLPPLAGDSGRIRVFINHVLAIDATNNSGGGIDFLSTHTYSAFADGAADADVILDFDDWMGADVPEFGGVESLDSIDWLLGTHVRSAHVISGNMGTWSGDIGFANQFFDPQFASNSTPNSTTPLDTIEGLTDVTDTERFPPGAVLGVASIASGVMATQLSGSATARVGYKLAGGATVWTDVTVNTSPNWKYGYYNPSGLTLPFIANPFSVLFEKANNVTNTFVYALAGLVEYVGIWGREDDPTLPIDLSNVSNFHNARFANTQWGYPNLGPVSAPTYAIGGTYVGNGTTQDIDLPAPVSFIWIRPLTGSSSGVYYIGPHVSPHIGLQMRGVCNLIVRVWCDDTGQHKFTVTGSQISSNANGVTFQYIAFCDPGMRFNATGVFDAPWTYASYSVPLYLSDFTPEAMIITPDYLENNTSTELYKYKGPGQVGTTGAKLGGGTAYANFGSFSAGLFSALADSIGLNLRTQQVYSAWRMLDPEGYLMVQLTGYIGDGTGFKVINLPHASGRYPLFAFVVSRSGTSYSRDPSHVGNHSTAIGALSDSTSAIVGGGIDQLFVGSTLNSNGVIYDVFVILGDSTGWNNGTFYPPGISAPGNWSEPPYNPPDLPIITGDGGMNFNGDVPLLAVENLSGIYTLVPGKTDDTIYTGIADDTVDVKKPDPTFKTGYVGG